MTIRVLIADDQALFREALTTLLEVQPGIEAVGEAGDGYGLQGLRERMANLGGRMSLDPAGATGLALIVEVPG